MGIRVKIRKKLSRLITFELNYTCSSNKFSMPSLVEFFSSSDHPHSLGNKFRAAEHQVAALPPPKEITPEGKAIIQGAVEQIRTPGFDFMHWARYPKSAQAMLEIARGARTESRLADILAEHIANGGVNCQPEAKKQLLVIAERKSLESSSA